MGRLILIVITCIIISVITQLVIRYIIGDTKNKETKEDFNANIDAVAKRIKNMK